MKNYKRLLCWFLLLLFLPSAQHVFAADDAADTDTSRLDQAIRISEGNPIEIEIINAPLQAALAAVTQKSSIHFEVPDDLRNDKIALRSSSRDWPEAIKRMLKKYNIAFGWQKNELKTVFIFERGSGKIVQLIPTRESDLSNPDPANSGQPDIDAQQESQVTPPLPAMPLEEEKIRNIKPGARQAWKREKKPEIENIEEFSKELFPEVTSDPSGMEDENAATSPVPDEPAPMKEK